MTYEEPLCSECKAAKATLLISVYSRGRAKEQRLMCAKCADDFERLTLGDSPRAGLCSLVAQVADKQAERAGASSRMGCPVCGTTLADVVTQGRPGCGACYTRFVRELEEMISATHGASVHRGKGPAKHQ